MSTHSLNNDGAARLLHASATIAAFVVGRAADGLSGAIRQGRATLDRWQAEQRFTSALAADPRMQADLRAARLNAERLADLGRAK